LIFRRPGMRRKLNQLIAMAAVVSLCAVTRPPTPAGGTTIIWAAVMLAERVR